MNFSEFFKNPKRKGLLPCILLALAAGVILLLLPESGGAQPQSVSTAQTYRETLERELEALICEMQGVESCTVVLTLSYGYEYVYATDQRVNEHSGGKETEKNVVLATENGSETPILLREKQPVVCGAAVVCPGADAALCLRISSLFSALFGLESGSVSIQT